MLTRPLDEDSRMLLLLMAADGIEATGRMLMRWWEKSSRRGRLADQLRNFESAGWVTAERGALDGRIVSLTTAGQRRVWGEVDPEVRWARPWDGTWRLALFDVPEAQAGLRTKLRRKLRELRFGWLQNSVWLSPDPVSELLRQLTEGKVSVESLLFLDGRPSGGETDAELVSGAWDFGQLGKMHADYLKLLRQRPAAGRGLRSAHWAAWVDAEHRAWNAVVRRDPLLPGRLLPSNYAGRTAWQARREALQASARALVDVCSHA